MWNLVCYVNGIIDCIFICGSFQDCLDHGVEKCFDIGEQGEEVEWILRNYRKISENGNIIELLPAEDCCIVRYI
jgi:hypothetical protein